MLLQAVLHFPIAQFDFPAMAVEFDDVSPREAYGIDYRGQYLALLAVDSASQQAGFYRLWQLRPGMSRLLGLFSFYCRCIRTNFSIS